MMDCNSVLLVGNLVRDPKVYTMNSGHKVAGFSLAVSKEWTSRNGEAKKKTSFPNCKAWGKDAEYIEQFRKGDRVAVLGEIETGSYEKNGQKVYTTDVLVERIMTYTLPKSEVGASHSNIESYAELSCPKEGERGEEERDVEIPF